MRQYQKEFQIEHWMSAEGAGAERRAGVHPARRTCPDKARAGRHRRGPCLGPYRAHRPAVFRNAFYAGLRCARGRGRRQAPRNCRGHRCIAVKDLEGQDAGDYGTCRSARRWSRRRWPTARARELAPAESEQCGRGRGRLGVEIAGLGDGTCGHAQLDDAAVARLSCARALAARNLHG